VIGQELELAKADLIVLTGDFMSYKGDEPAALAMMRSLAPRLHARLGVFGVFGNHDTDTFRKQCLELPVTWVGGRRTAVDENLEVLGFDTGLTHGFDSVAHLLNGEPIADSGTRRLRVLLAHTPASLPAAADLGIDVMFSGHTHGGQCRLPFKRALLNSTDLPLTLTSGVLRHQNTLALVSRGLGEVKLPLRVLCSPQLPVYTFRRGPLPGEFSYGMTNTRPW
jgi:predicted MPP superfamily phosphohydrolase